MVDNIVVRSPGARLAKPVGGLATVLMLAVGIVLFSIAHLIENPQSGAFAIDTGLVLVCVALTLPVIEYRRTAVRALLLGLLAIVLFAIFDYAELTVMVYVMRLFVPLMAFMVTLSRISNGYRLFA